MKLGRNVFKVVRRPNVFHAIEEPMDGVHWGSHVDQYGKVDAEVSEQEAYQIARAVAVLLVMVESREAIENLPEFLKMKEIDA